MVQWYEIKIDYYCHLGGKSVKKARKYLILAVAALVLIIFIANPGASNTRRTGWFENEGQYHYYNEKGDKVTGWLIRDDGSYYLTETGRVTGWQEIEGQRRYFDSDGIMVLGWHEIDGSTYFFGEGGAPLTGLVSIGEKSYGFDAQGVRLTGWQEFDGQTYYLDTDGSLKDGWVQDDGHTYYMEAGVPVTGILVLAEEKFFFDSRGWNILMVNPWNTVPEGYEVQTTSVGGDHYIAKEAAGAFSNMIYAMQQLELGPIITSSYRTITRQQEIFDERMAGYMEQGMTEEEAYALTATSVAIPGTSEHQLGLAMDMTDAFYNKLDEGQMETPTQLWLIENSWKYGFILRYPDGKSEITGIIYEPWHYRYVGKELAAELKELNLTMEEYLDQLTEDKSLTASNPANGNTMK